MYFLFRYFILKFFPRQVWRKPILLEWQFLVREDATASYSALQVSYTLLSAKELITMVVGDSFERQHESQRYQASRFLEDIHLFLVLERNLSLGTVISLQRNQLLSKYLQYYF